MGYPTIIVIGKAYLESPARYEVYRSTRPDIESGTQTTPYSTPAALLLTEAELLSHLEGNDEQLIKSSA